MTEKVKNVVNKNYPITNEEYELINKEFGQLAHKAAWDLKRMNFKNNFIDDEQDVFQDLNIAFMDAASYYKRQVFIENSLDLLRSKVNDEFTQRVIEELTDLWDNKTRHGAGKQKFGPYQEIILDNLLNKYITTPERPSKTKPLEMNDEFSIYCKQVMWNRQRNLGKKITREKSIRASQVSLSEFDYLGCV